MTSKDKSKNPSTKEAKKNPKPAPPKLTKADGAFKSVFKANREIFRRLADR